MLLFTASLITSPCRLFRLKRDICQNPDNHPLCSTYQSLTSHCITYLYLVPGESAEASGEALVDMVLAIHGSCEKLGATPRDYMAFLRVWHGLHQQKKQELLRDLGHLEAGLSKLESAAEVVSDLRTNAVQQQKAEVKRTVADNESKTQARKAEIEAELSEIQPVLDAAKQAVGMIKNEHLNEIRSLNAPPEAIADVLAAVLMILGVQVSFYSFSQPTEPSHITSFFHPNLRFTLFYLLPYYHFPHYYRYYVVIL